MILEKIFHKRRLRRSWLIWGKTVTFFDNTKDDPPWQWLPVFPNKQLPPSIIYLLRLSFLTFLVIELHVRNLLSWDLPSKILPYAQLWSPQGLVSILLLTFWLITYFVVTTSFKMSRHVLCLGCYVYRVNRYSCFWTTLSQFACNGNSGDCDCANDISRELFPGSCAWLMWCELFTHSHSYLVWI